MLAMYYGLNDRGEFISFVLKITKCKGHDQASLMFKYIVISHVSKIVKADDMIIKVSIYLWLACDSCNLSQWSRLAPYHLSILITIDDVSIITYIFSQMHYDNTFNNSIHERHLHVDGLSFLMHINP